jgi:hypothetical protein
MLSIVYHECHIRLSVTNKSFILSVIILIVIMLIVIMLIGIMLIVIMEEKTCFHNKSKFITEDNFVQHLNIPI